MRLWYSGFNLYNQIDSNNDPLINDLKDFKYEDAKSIILGDTFVITHRTDTISFRGNPNQHICIQENIEYITAADNNVFILYSNGKISKIDTSKLTLNYVSNFLNVENCGDSPDYIVKISCGSTLNVAVSRNNLVFNIPNRLQFCGKKIIQICTGHEHCLILDSNGDVYSFGCGIRGQLGHGTLESEENPRLIEALAGLKMRKIACGGWHSSAISITGDLYTWGWNSNGQLGLSGEENVSVYATPQWVSLDVDSNIDDVACGSKHTVILIASTLYGVGWNKYKQLGPISEENVRKFKLMKDFSCEKISSIKCGAWCTGIITET